MKVLRGIGTQLQSETKVGPLLVAITLTLSLMLKYDGVK